MSALDVCISLISVRNHRFMLVRFGIKIREVNVPLA